MRAHNTGGKEDSPHRRKGGLTGQEERRTHRRKGHRMGEFLEKLEMRELINDGGTRKDGRREGPKELAA